MTGFLAGAAAMFAVMYSTQAILPEIGAAFGMSPSRAGLTISVLVLAMIPGAWIWGPLSDRIGRRRTLVLASGLLVPVSVLVPLAPSFGALVALRALQGLVMPGLLAVGVPYVSEVFVPRFGARVMGWYMASLILGGLLGRVGVAFAALALGWRGSLALVALLPLLATVLMRRGLPEAPPRARRGAAPAPVPSGVDPRLVGALTIGPALFFAFVGTFTFVRYRLEAAPFDLPPAVTGAVFGLWVLGVLAPASGRLAERWGWRGLALGSLALALAGIALTLPQVLATTVVGLALLTVGMFAGSTAAQVALGGVRGARLGTASALYYSLYYGAGAVAAFVPGLAWESGGWPAVALCTGGVLVAAIAGLAALGYARRSAPAPRPHEAAA